MDKIPEAEIKMVIDEDKFIYIPIAKLWFAKKRTSLNKNWDETWATLLEENLEMPAVEEFRVSLKYLRDSKEKEHNSLYEEITQLRPPYRANWLDAYFEKRSDGMYLLTKNKTKAEKLQDCLMQNRDPGISLDEWLDGKNVTSQGLPNRNISDGDLHYWNPVDGRVARFDADSGRTYLDGSWGPSHWYDVLGVFAVSHVSSDEKLEDKPEIKFPSTYKNPFEYDLPRIDKIENVVYNGQNPGGRN